MGFEVPFTPEALADLRWADMAARKRLRSDLAVLKDDPTAGAVRLYGANAYSNTGRNLRVIYRIDQQRHQMTILAATQHEPYHQIRWRGLSIVAGPEIARVTGADCWLSPRGTVAEFKRLLTARSHAEKWHGPWILLGRPSVVQWVLTAYHDGRTGAVESAAHDAGWVLRELSWASYAIRRLKTFGHGWSHGMLRRPSGAWRPCPGSPEATTAASTKVSGCCRPPPRQLTQGKEP